MKKFFSILVSTALLATANYSLAKQENPYQVGTGSYELSRDQIDFLVQYINQSKTTLEDAVARASSQDLYSSFQTLLLATKKVIPLSSSIKPRDELLLRVALNQALELTVGVPNANGNGVVKKGVLASSIALSSNIDLYNIILSDSINLALKYSEFDSKAVTSGSLTELPYDIFSMERLTLLRQWSAFYMPETTAYEFLRSGLTQWLSSMNPKYLLTRNAEYAESLVAAQNELNAQDLAKDPNRVRRLKVLISKILEEQEISSNQTILKKSENFQTNVEIQPVKEYSFQRPKPSLSYRDVTEGRNLKENLVLRNTNNLENIAYLHATGKAGTFTGTNGVPTGIDLGASFATGVYIPVAFSLNDRIDLPNIELGVALKTHLSLDLSKEVFSNDSLSHYDFNGILKIPSISLNLKDGSKNSYLGYLKINLIRAEANYRNDLVDEKNKTRIEIADGGIRPGVEFHTFFPFSNTVAGEFCFATNPVGFGGAQVIGRKNDTKKFVNEDQYGSIGVSSDHSVCFGVNILGYVEIKDQVSAKFLLFSTDEANEKPWIFNFTNELSINRIGGSQSPVGAYYDYSRSQYMKYSGATDEQKTVYTVNRHMFGIKLEY